MSLHAKRPAHRVMTAAGLSTTKGSFVMPSENPTTAKALLGWLSRLLHTHKLTYLVRESACAVHSQVNGFECITKTVRSTCVECLVHRDGEQFHMWFRVGELNHRYLKQEFQEAREERG